MAPALPVRVPPRATDEQIEEWVRQGRADLVARELLLEQEHADELERRGRWAR